MKTNTNTILATIIACSVMLFLAACGKKEPSTASEVAVEAEAVAGSDDAKDVQKEAEAAADAVDAEVPTH